MANNWTQVLPGTYPAGGQSPIYPGQVVLNTTKDIPPEVSDFFNGYVGIIARRRCVLHYLAELTSIEAKSGNTLVIPTFKRISRETLPILQEGVTPMGAKLEREDLKITPKQLGTYAEITDVIALTVQDQTLQNAAYALGLDLSEVCDRMIAQALDQTMNVGYATGGVPNVGNPGNATPGFIQESDIIIAANFLKQNSAYMVSPNLFGSTIYGSSPIRESFYCFCNVKCEPDLYRIPSFIDLARYGSSEFARWLPGEIGECMNVRFVSSQNLPEDTTSVNATAQKPFLSNFFVGRYAYYVTRLGKGSTQFKFTQTGFDPLGQRIQIGYKTWYGAAINTAHKWVYKLVSRTAATIKP